MSKTVQFDRFFGQIGYSGSHDRSISNLAKGRADAAFISSTALRAEETDQKDSTYRILWRSKPIPRDPFVFKSTLCANIKKKIVAVFLTPNEEGKALRMKHLNGSHFVSIRDEDYQVLRELP